VAARFKGSRQLFAGVVQKRNKDGSYWVVFDDGDNDRRVKPANLGVYNPDDYEDPADDAAEAEDPLQRLDATRPLTAEEFEKIRKLRTKRELEASLGKSRGPDSESMQVSERLGAEDVLGYSRPCLPPCTPRVPLRVSLATHPPSTRYAALFALFAFLKKRVALPCLGEKES